MLYTKDYSLKVFGEEAKYKIIDIKHLENEEQDTISTLIYITVYAQNNGRTIYKNYSFFVPDVHLNFNKGDYISILRIDSVDRATVFSKGKVHNNVNVNGEVELFRENKSATEREVEAVTKDLPF